MLNRALPFWAWLLGFTVILTAGALEYAHRKSSNVPIAKTTMTVSITATKIPRCDSPLQIVVGEGPDFDTGSATKGRRTLYTIDRHYGAALTNIDERHSIRDCKLAVIAIEPAPGWRMPRTLADGLAVNPGDRILIPLACYQERREGSSSGSGSTIIEIGDAAGDSLSGISVGLDNILTLRATGADVPPCEVRCRVWVENDKLRIMRVA